MIVTPAKAGVQSLPLARTGGNRFGLPALDSRFRGNDDREQQLVGFPRFILGQPLSETPSIHPLTLNLGLEAATCQASKSR